MGNRSNKSVVEEIQLSQPCGVEYPRRNGPGERIGVENEKLCVSQVSKLRGNSPVYIVIVKAELGNLPQTTQTRRKSAHQSIVSGTEIGDIGHFRQKLRNIAVQCIIR